MASSTNAFVIFDPDMLRELEVSQRMAAQFLECGYLALRDFPDLSRKVTLTADDAQTQHMMSLGLIKKFRSTAHHVVETIIPLVTDGVEIQVYETARDAFDSVTGYAKKMKSETEETQKRYYLMRHNVQMHIREMESHAARGQCFEIYCDRDVKYLEAASTELGKVQEHLSKIALFWEDFEGKIETLVGYQDPAKVLLRHVEKPEVAKRLVERLNNISQYWTSFGGVCLEYVTKNSSEVEHLYKFLSA